MLGPHTRTACVDGDELHTGCINVADISVVGV